MALPCIPEPAGAGTCWGLSWGNVWLGPALKWPSHPGRVTPSCAAGSGPHCVGRKSHSPGEVCKDQLTPALDSGALPRPPRDLPHLPREDDQPELVGHGHFQFPAHKKPCSGSWLSLEMFSGMICRLPLHHDIAQHLLPQYKRQQPRAPSKTLGKSWVHQSCALGKCPMAPLTDGPFLHPQHVLWTLASLLKGKTMTSASHLL